MSINGADSDRLNLNRQKSSGVGGSLGLSLLWQNAGQRMPFQRPPDTPMFIPATMNINMHEAKGENLAR